MLRARSEDLARPAPGATYFSVASARSGRVQYWVSSLNSYAEISTVEHSNSAILFSRKFSLEFQYNFRSGGRRTGRKPEAGGQKTVPAEQAAVRRGRLDGARKKSLHDRIAHIHISLQGNSRFMNLIARLPESFKLSAISAILDAKIEPRKINRKCPLHY